jgi:hypothetical protein
MTAPITPAQFDGFRPGRLWSLWEMLIKFEAHTLIETLTHFEEMHAIARNNASWVYLDTPRAAVQMRRLDTIETEAAKLSLRLSVKKVRTLKIILADEANGRAESVDALATVISQRFEELRELIWGELEVHTIYCVDLKNADVLKTLPVPFGSVVTDKFPSAAEDIAEAAWCLALSRNTAAIFHLMRAMEIAVHAIGVKFNVSVIDKNNIDLEWGKILANLKAPIEALPRGADRDSWSEVLTLLYHVKQTWRNSTMHPKQTYTDDEAATAYESVKSFMHQLSALV